MSAEIGLNKILLFPDKLKALLAATGTAPEMTYPISVELSLTNECNQNCVWCSDYELRNRLPGALAKETIFRLVDDLKAGGTRGVVIEGGGEPTLHPHFRAIVQYISEAGLAVGMITNGVTLPYADLLDRFEWIRVSLDAGDAEEYKELKGNDYFAQVMANIATIARGCRVCGVGYIVTERNIDNLEALTLRLKKKGVKYIHFRPVVDCPELATDADLTYLKRFEGAGFSILADALTENKVRGNAGHPCLAHSVTSIVAASGDVFICGRLNIYDWVKPLGNINTTAFSDIWRGAERRLQAAQVADPTFCHRNCPECRITKYNTMLDGLRRISTRNFI